MVYGHCDEKFSELKKILEQQLNSDFELGASVAVEWKGKEVVNLYGGYKDENKNSKWNENTIVNVFSVTKAISGICITRLIDAGLLDVKKNVDRWEVFTHGGRNNSGIDALEYAKKMENCGAGELLVTSMDRDGTQVGYDIDLMSKISSKVNIPVIASGGVGNLDHLVDGIKLGKASAVLAASIFHYGKHSVREAKEYLNSKGIPVRV